MNLQIEVADVDALHRRVSAASAHIVLALEERWYRRDREELGNRQFIVADPDGYLLRFFTDLGRRTVRHGLVAAEDHAAEPADEQRQRNADQPVDQSLAAGEGRQSASTPVFDTSRRSSARAISGLSENR